jgi:hypothetical protein
LANEVADHCPDDYSGTDSKGKWIIRATQHEIRDRCRAQQDPQNDVPDRIQTLPVKALSPSEDHANSLEGPPACEQQA